MRYLEVVFVFAFGVRVNAFTAGIFRVNTKMKLNNSEKEHIRGRFSRVTKGKIKHFTASKRKHFEVDVFSHQGVFVCY